MVKSDKNWEAEYDADTMVRYQEIISDNKRFAAAKKAAAKRASEYEKSYKNAQAVSRMKKK